MNESINDKDVYRTAPATQGLLNVRLSQLEFYRTTFFKNTKKVLSP